MAMEELRVADVELWGDSLGWHPGVRKTWPNSSLLSEFVRLAQAPDDLILRFAQRWGVLELCKHLLPACHSDCQPMSFKPMRDKDALFMEPLSEWRRYAAIAGGLLSVANRLNEEKTPDEWDWEPIRQLAN